MWIQLERLQEFARKNNRFKTLQPTSTTTALMHLLIPTWCKNQQVRSPDGTTSGIKTQIIKQAASKAAGFVRMRCLETQVRRGVHLHDPKQRKKCFLWGSPRGELRSASHVGIYDFEAWILTTFPTEQQIMGIHASVRRKYDKNPKVHFKECMSELGWSGLMAHQNITDPVV